jgi:tRNA threonylcarbamoyl adenosine modification protein YeaZ
MIFLIDTTTNPTAIGIYDFKDLKIKIIESNPENNRKLVSIIQSFLTTKSYKPKDITAVGVINGPGTFTGVRTGVTIANTIVYALKVPLYSIDSLTTQAPAMITDIVSLISASNSEVFFARFYKGKIEGKIELVDTMNLPNRLNDGDIVVGDLQEKHCGLISKQEFQNRSSADRIKKLMDLILCKKIKPQKMVLPFYIKKPNITQAKSKK